MAKRLPTKIRDIEGLEFLNVDDLLDIERAAASISLDDCFDLLMVDKAEIPPYDLSVATKVHKRGRASGVQTAVDKLFTHMSTRAGGTSSLEYLKQMSGEFQVEATPLSQGKGFSFAVNIPGEDK